MNALAKTLCCTLATLLVSFQVGCSESPAESTEKKGDAKKAELGSRVIDINNAPIEDLQLLPGVGEVTAKRIIEKRPFKKVEELQDVEGIGDKTYESIKPHVVVNPPSAAPAAPAPAAVTPTPEG